MGYWYRDTLRKLASAIERPLYIDSFIAFMIRISYSCILVEVDVSQPLVEAIDISTPYGDFQQTLDYDWKPRFFKHCIKFGHDSKTTEIE